MSNTSLFRFWKASQLNRGGLYISFGEQGGIVQGLEKKYPEPVPVIIEYTALISIWSLWGRTWKNELSKLFSTFLFPESFRTVLSMERSLLFQPEQDDRYRAKKRLLEIITDPSTPFKPFEINDATLSDEEKERKFAEEKNLFYLNEFTSNNRYKNEIGFMELTALLRTTGRITPNQEKKLLKIAKQRDFIAIEQLKQLKTDIVVNLVCLTELVLLELLEPFLKQFKTIYYLEKEIWFLKQELRDFEFRQELKVEFVQFEETIFETDNRIQWFQETSQPEYNND
ncbi:MAG: hypothetical protein JXA43_01715, partial [Candidatus Diapherotrites archaeon]|nr:hypothetical protein [Candidatus Diapherotrites archaeon]